MCTSLWVKVTISRTALAAVFDDCQATEANAQTANYLEILVHIYFSIDRANSRSYASRRKLLVADAEQVAFAASKDLVTYDC